MTTESVSRSPTLVEVLRQAFDYYLDDVWTFLPGKIVSFDAAQQKADVQLLVSRRLATENGEEIVETPPILPDVPVHFPRVRDFKLTFPLAAGDHVRVHFAMRSIDNYMSGDGEITDPGDFRLHDLNDAICEPGFFPFSKNLSPVDNSAVVVGKDNGTVVRVGDGVIELGVQGSTDKASLDSKVQIELNALRTSFDALVTVFNAHTHIASSFGAPTTPPVPQGVPPATIGQTASTLVTIEK